MPSLSQDPALAASRSGQYLPSRHGLASGAEPLPLGTALLWFTLLGSLFLAVAYLDRRPAPIFPRLLPTEETIPGSEAFRLGETLDLEFQLPRGGLRSIYFPQLLYSDHHKVRVVVRNRSRGDEILSDTVLLKGDKVPVGRGTRHGDRIALSLTWLRDAPPLWHSPALLSGWRSELPGTVPATLELAAGEDAPLRMARSPRPILLGGKQPLLIQFEAPAAGISSIRLPGLEGSAGTSVEVILSNETRGVRLKRSVVKDGEVWERTFTPDNAAGDLLSLTLTWLPMPPVRLRMPQSRPSIPVSSHLAGATLPSVPPFLLQYEWRSKWLLLGWIIIPAALFLCLRYRARPDLYLVGLGLLGMVTGYLAWQQNYSHFLPQADPDGYGIYAQHLYEFFTGRMSWTELNAWFGTYSHAHLPLTPIAVDLLHAAGLPWSLAYTAVTALAGFLSLLVCYRIAARHLNLSHEGTLLTVTVLGCHFFFLKAFGRASTDAMGTLLILLTFELVLRRLHRASLWSNLWIILIIIANALARPSGLAYLPFIVGAALACDAVRNPQWAWKPALGTGLLLGAAPLGVLAFLYDAADWYRCLGLSFTKASHYQGFSTMKDFLSAALPMINLLPLFLIAAAWWRWSRGQTPRRPETWAAIFVLLAWPVFYLLLLIAVQAPFFHRLFLPMVPALVLVAGVGLCKWARYSPRLATFCVLLLCGINIAIVTYGINLDELPPEAIAPYIY